MIKITITIEEVPEKKSEKKPEPIVGKYIITKSNYDGAYIMGIPCKIMSEPYVGSKHYFGKNNTDNYIKVMSCITMIEYEIPYSPEWFEMYDTFNELLATAEAENLLHRGYHIFYNPLSLFAMRSLVGKEYYPIDNSYSEDINGERLWVANKVVKIVDVPFIGKNPYGDDKWFVTVKTKDGKIGKCLFEEWKLVP